MENFWIRFKNVEIDCACLEQERNELKKENDLLKGKLRRYLEEISITNGRVGATEERLRPQSMKINRIQCTSVPNTSKKFKNLPRPVTGVEANLSVAVRSHNLVPIKTKIPDVYAVIN